MRPQTRRALRTAHRAPAGVSEHLVNVQLRRVWIERLMMTCRRGGLSLGVCFRGYGIQVLLRCTGVRPCWRRETESQGACTTPWRTGFAPLLCMAPRMAPPTAAACGLPVARASYRGCHTPHVAASWLQPFGSVVVGVPGTLGRQEWGWWESVGRACVVTYAPLGAGSALAR